LVCIPEVVSRRTSRSRPVSPLRSPTLSTELRRAFRSHVQSRSCSVLRPAAVDFLAMVNGPSFTSKTPAGRFVPPLCKTRLWSCVIDQVAAPLHRRPRVGGPTGRAPSSVGLTVS
jgi:hypothetical protein